MRALHPRLFCPPRRLCLYDVVLYLNDTHAPDDVSCSCQALQVLILGGHLFILRLTY